MAPKRTINPIEIKPKPKKTRRSKARKPKLSIKMSLEEAVKSGNLEVVNHFLKLDFDLDERNETGMTILHIAIQNRHYEIVKALLAHGANTDVYICCQNLYCKNSYSGHTPLMLAIACEQVEIVKELLKHGADLTYQVESYNALYKQHVSKYMNITF